MQRSSPAGARASTDLAQAPATSQTLQLPDAAARSSVKRAEYLEGRLAQDDHAKGGRELRSLHAMQCITFMDYTVTSRPWSMLMSRLYAGPKYYCIIS